MACAPQQMLDGDGVQERKKHLKNVRTVDHGVKIHRNLGNLRTNQQGNYGTIKVWYIPEGIESQHILYA